MTNSMLVSYVDYTEVDFTKPFCIYFTEKKKPHIKKPLNAFMLYMKEMRQQVVSECTLKESAAINQILGRRVSLESV